MRPLDGIVVVEMAGLGPVPFAAMWLADMGADVVRVDRPPRTGGHGEPSLEPAFMRRGRRSVAVDLKHPAGRDAVLDLVASAHALVEGFRPGVMERLGLAPDTCRERNRRLVYGRMTGWGQQGPWASMAGHDIDYLALSGVLGAIGPAGHPVPPLNLIGDYGGAMMLIAGVLAGLLAARTTGEGCVVDAAMTDSAAYLATLQYAMIGEGWWRPEREANLLDGGAPFYSTYETADGRHMAVGALEPQFYAALLAGLGLESEQLPDQHSIEDWPLLRRRFAEVFATRTRDEWETEFEGTDACVAPVLSLAEAPGHPHNVARATFVDHRGAGHPAPTPRFDPADPPPGPRLVRAGEHTDEVLEGLGYTTDRITRLRSDGAVV